MPLIAGLVVTLLGAVVATIVFLAITIAEYATSVDLMTLLEVAIEIIPYGLLYGFLFFFPIALLLLPLSHAILRRYAVLGVPALVATGLVASILLMWAIILVDKIDGADALLLSRRTLNFSAVAGITGALVGFAFAAFTRWWRPFEWPGYRAIARGAKPQDRANGPRLQPGRGERR
jgi:hypothetical protein